MKNVKKMTYKELEDEVVTNRSLYATASREEWRALCVRDHELMTEMNARWDKVQGPAVWGA